MPLIAAETVQLVLGEFESASDFTEHSVQSIPPGAFARASWSEPLKQLTLTLGSNIGADQ
eukprot:CAMPEP_0173442232 /NCGR_PEP_ID=MMETSP1357-20121228/25983_1 /TAXON_ID=77926 /ORGANISM="Hemiselmis rufescens, Strain PCC563" /LENGTH=59 /DNA_ID=CAMNT_0014407933 /DNA_START=42 /DNA_END=218 /DNA_ORIENTATION=+